MLHDSNVAHTTISELTASNSNLNLIQNQPTKKTKSSEKIDKKVYPEIQSNEISGIDITNEPSRTMDTNVCISSPLPMISSKNLPKLYPPGRILHVVRKYPREAHLENRNSLTILNDVDTNVNCNKPFRASTIIATTDLERQKSKKFAQFKGLFKDSSNNSSKQTLVQPVYQVIETDNKHFNELLISPRMLQDHMPDNLIKCMKAVRKLSLNTIRF